MKKLISLVFLLFLLLAYTVNAQKLYISGEVKAETNDMPISFAMAICYKAGVAADTTFTDNKGEFTFKNLQAAMYTISIVLKGYKPVASPMLSIEENAVAPYHLKFKLKQEGTQQLADRQLDSLQGEEKIKAAADVKAKVETEQYIRTQASIIPKLHLAGSKMNVSGGRAAGGYIFGGNTNYTTRRDYSNEEYKYIEENVFLSPEKDPFSTFSIDVDRASYANVRRFLTNGDLPPKDAVRIEELVNYFDYTYPEAKAQEPFALKAEAARCPWNNNNLLLRIGIKGKNIETKELPPANLVFLIDVSGSMEDYDKLPLVKRSLELLVAQLRPQDKVAIVVYAGAAGLVLPSTSGRSKEKIMAALEDLSAGGSTAGGEGIELAYAVAEENQREGNVNRVILCTDGDFNVGVNSDADLCRLIEAKRNKGVFLTVLGFGEGNTKDSKMETLANKGNGNYAYVDNLLEAEKVLIKEMGATLLTIAKDVKLQVEFNPRWIKSYRLIGYENRKLNDRDFNDDKKDAGELEAGHCVTAFYEVVPVGAANDPSGSVDPLRYQQNSDKDNADRNAEAVHIKLRYKEPDGLESKLLSYTVPAAIATGFEEASADLRFAAAVAEWGMLLRRSQFVEKGSYRQVEDIARNAKGADEEGYRAEFIRLVQLSAKLQHKPIVINCE